MKILIDSNEPPEVVNQIKRFPKFQDAEIEVKKLPAGDVWIGDITIERKSITDLLSSISDNRLSNQAAAMRAMSEWCYLVICGPLYWLDKNIIGTGWHFRSVQGQLLKVQELGVNVVHSENELDFAKTCHWLWTHDRSKITILDPRKYGIPMTKQQEILASLPGIGAEKSDILMNEYGSVVKALIALTDDSQPLPKGFAKKTRQNIREILGLDTDEMIKRSKQNE